MLCFCDLVHQAPTDDDDRGFLSDMDCSKWELFDFPEFLRMCCLPKGYESQLNLDSQSNSSFGIYSKSSAFKKQIL